MLKIMNQPLQLMQFSAQISNFAFCKPLPSAEFKPFMCKPPSFKSSVLRQSQGQSMPHTFYVLTYTTGLNWHPDKDSYLIHLTMSILHLFYAKLWDSFWYKNTFFLAFQSTFSPFWFIYSFFGSIFNLTLSKNAFFGPERKFFRGEVGWLYVEGGGGAPPNSTNIEWKYSIFHHVPEMFS